MSFHCNLQSKRRQWNNRAFGQVTLPPPPPLLLPRVPKIKIQVNSHISCESTAEEVSFEWSHHRILSTDSKVRITLNVSATVSGSETVYNQRSCPVFFSFGEKFRWKGKTKNSERPTKENTRVTLKFGLIVGYTTWSRSSLAWVQ